MPSYKIPVDIKQEIIGKIKQGEKVKDLSSTYAVSDKTIYRCLQKKTLTNMSALEIGRLKRERDDLLKLVGTLTLRIDKHKKK